MFSGNREVVVETAKNYQFRNPEITTAVYDLFEGYKQEQLPMPYTVADFAADFTTRHLGILSPKVLAKNIPVEDVLKEIPPNDRLKGLSLNDRLQGYSPDEIEAYLEKITSKAKPKKKKKKS